MITKEKDEDYLKLVVPQPPGAELGRLNIVKTFGDSREEAQKNAYKTAQQVVGYLENAGANKIMPKYSELGKILFG